jgi:catechol 2,3-dioxygenase-like lactoylglutathione lyase family enzyme
MKCRILTILAVFLGVSVVAQTPDLRFHGLKIQVTDLEEARQFYGDVLGFAVDTSGFHQGRIMVVDPAFPIYLVKAKKRNPSRYLHDARTGLSIQTNHLLPRLDQLRKSGVTFYDMLLARNGVGISIPFADPFGNVISLIEVQIREVPPFPEPRIYNTGVTIPDMEAATLFYRDLLGFQEWSRDYLPQALPLKHTDGSFAFMIHSKPGLHDNRVRYPDQCQMIIILESEDLQKTMMALQPSEIPLTYVNHGGMEYLTLSDPSGNVLEVVQR